jgi:very-short-patch-repair endonuclease
VAISFTAKMVRNRLARRCLRRIHRGVYAVGGDLEVELGAETAALLAVGEGCMLGQRSALWLWGLTAEAPEGVEVIVAAPLSAKSRPGIRVRRSTTLTALDVTLHRGLPVTTPARTLLDLATYDPDRRAVEQALDEGLARRLVSATKLRDAAARAPGLRGGRVLEELLDPDRARGVTRSQAEERLLEIIRRAGLPDPERNVRIGPFTVDFLWRASGLVIEVDSYTWHGTPGAFKRDRRKEAYLATQRMELIRVTWEMLEDPIALVARVARAIGARSQAA